MQGLVWLIALKLTILMAGILKFLALLVAFAALLIVSQIVSWMLDQFFSAAAKEKRAAKRMVERLAALGSKTGGTSQDEQWLLERSLLDERDAVQKAALRSFLEVARCSGQRLANAARVRLALELASHDDRAVRLQSLELLIQLLYGPVELPALVADSHPVMQWLNAVPTQRLAAEPPAGPAATPAHVEYLERHQMLGWREAGTDLLAALDVLAAGYPALGLSPITLEILIDLARCVDRPAWRLADDALRRLIKHPDFGVFRAADLETLLGYGKMKGEQRIELALFALRHRPDLATPGFIDLRFSKLGHSSVGDFQLLARALELAQPGRSELVDVILDRIEAAGDKHQDRLLWSLRFAVAAGWNLRAAQVDRIILWLKHAILCSAALTALEPLAGLQLEIRRELRLRARGGSAVETPSSNTQSAGAWSLSGDQVAKILSVADNPEGPSREHALEVFHQLAAEASSIDVLPEHVEVLRRCVRNTDLCVAAAAATALAGLGDTPAASLLNRTDIEAMQNLLQPAAGLPAKCKHSRANARATALLALERCLGNTLAEFIGYGDLERLLPLLQDEDPDVQWRASGLVGHIADGRFDPLLKRFGPLPEGYLSRMIAFIGQERNPLLRNEKSSLLHQLLFRRTGESVFDLVGAHLDDVQRERRLGVCRQLTTILEGKAMEAGDGAREWTIFLDQFVPRFGYLAHRDAVLVHRYLSQNVPLSDPRLQGRVNGLGITATGEAGIDQLTQRIQQVNQSLLERRTISVEDVAHPKLEAIVGAATLFYSGQWSHGATCRLHLKEFVKAFHDWNQFAKPVPLSPAFQRETTFRVRRRGQAHFTEDARQKFEEYAVLIRRAAEISEESADQLLYWLREEARRTLDAQLNTILARLKAAAAIAQPSLRQQADKLGDAIARIDASDVLEIARLLNWNKDARELAVLSLLAAAFISYPSSRPLMLSAVAGGIDLGAAALLEFRTDTIGAELLGRLPENERAKLLTLLPMAIFAQELARIQAIEEGAVQVRARSPLEGFWGNWPLISAMRAIPESSTSCSGMSPARSRPCSLRPVRALTRPGLGLCSSWKTGLASSQF